MSLELSETLSKDLHFWPGQRLWNYFRDRLIDQFGERVYKVGVDAGFDCPNRDGTKAFGGCAYCSQDGSLSPHQDPALSIRDQVVRGRAFCLKRYGAHKYIVYFQAFSNTYATPEIIQQRFDAALIDDSIVGLSVATRPDCIDEARAQLLKSYSEKMPFFTVELGLQSAYQNRLEWVNRQEDVADFVRAMELLTRHGVRVVTHVMLGFPGESTQDMLDTVNLAQFAGSSGIKLQMLHVIKGTKLAHLYQKEPFELMNQQQYLDLIVFLVERLNPKVEIHRITGETANSHLIAPLWVSQKPEFFLKFENELRARGTYQGRLYQAASLD